MRSRVSLPVAALLLLATLSFAGCATPTSRLRALAETEGFDRSAVRADGFLHTVFANAIAPVDGVLHVYLEGDGTPWRHRTIIMPDPTPRRPLMLGLMALDDSASVYVGRPCYNGTYAEPGCDNRLWTSDRYSERVVASMAAVVRGRAARLGARHVRLFGHSGGAALALLIAERVPAVDAVVTVAGNLDTDAWTTHHGYSPLHGSLNPARRPPLPHAVRQWHLLGGADAVIPPMLVTRYLQGRPDAVAMSLSGYGHGCCWRAVWPDVLRAVADGRPDELPGVPVGSLSGLPADASAEPPSAAGRRASRASSAGRSAGGSTDQAGTRAGSGGPSRAARSAAG